jgi:hypothetical protein
MASAREGSHEATGFHHAFRRRCGHVAARGASAAAENLMTVINPHTINYNEITYSLDSCYDHFCTAGF